jgi:hypothetical protein
MSTEAKAPAAQGSEGASPGAVPLPRAATYPDGTWAEGALPGPALPPWVRRVAALGAIVVGWGYIGWHNHFNFTPAVGALALGWGACVSTLYFLFRVGAAAADPSIDREDWWLATGAREELEREKRSLLKSIREIEFDHQTGKLSDRDADEMTQVFRARAIEVYKALDEAEGGGVRSEIEREVRARIEVERARNAAKTVKPNAAAAGKAGRPAKKTAVRSATAIDAKPAIELDPSEADTEGAGATAADGDESGDARAVAVAASSDLEAANPAEVVTPSGSTSSEVSP